MTNECYSTDKTKQKDIFIFLPCMLFFNILLDIFFYWKFEVVILNSFAELYATSMEMQFLLILVHLPKPLTNPVL